MTKEWIKQFVGMAKSGAQFKAYNRQLGLNRLEIKAHLARLPEYERMLSEVVGDQHNKRRAYKRPVEPSVEVVEEVVKKSAKPHTITEDKLIEKLTDREMDETDKVSEEDENL